ncbi:MAG: hypothetical protein ACK44C_08570 [Polaromonas sp.]
MSKLALKTLGDDGTSPDAKGMTKKVALAGMVFFLFGLNSYWKNRCGVDLHQWLFGVFHA